MMVVPNILAPMACPRCGGEIEVHQARHTGDWSGWHDRSWKPCEWGRGVWGYFKTREALEAALPEGPRPMPSLASQIKVNEIVGSMIRARHGSLERLRSDMERLMKRLEKLETNE